MVARAKIAGRLEFGAWNLELVLYLVSCTLELFGGECRSLEPPTFNLQLQPNEVSGQSRHRLRHDFQTIASRTLYPTNRTMGYVLFPSQSGSQVSGQSHPQLCWPHSRKKLGFASTLMIISNPDRAVTVKERDPITDRDLRRVPNKGVQRIAFCLGPLAPASECRSRSFTVTALFLVTPA